MIGKNKISGVVCEFNPLHNGHAALLSRISEEFGSDIVCVMSGNFVQRGEAAVLDKVFLELVLRLRGGIVVVNEAYSVVAAYRYHFVKTVVCVRLDRAVVER